MSDLYALHRQALDATGAYVAGTTADHLGAPTPCVDWDVRGLLNHIIGGNLWVVPLVGGKTIAEVGDSLDGDHVGDDAGAAYTASAEAAAAAFAAAPPDAPCKVSYGPIPAEAYVGHRFVDVLVHGWDLAVATGQDTTLDPAMVDACWTLLLPELEMLQASGMFGTPGAAPAEGGRQAQLLAALGRSA